MIWNGLPCCVIGAADFGGLSLTQVLLDLERRVTGLDVTLPSHASPLDHELEYPNFRYVWKSLQDIQPGNVDGHAVAVHLAAQADTSGLCRARYTLLQNIYGTVPLLEAARRAGRTTDLRRFGQRVRAAHEPAH